MGGRLGRFVISQNGKFVNRRYNIRLAAIKVSRYWIYLSRSATRRRNKKSDESKRHGLDCTENKQIKGGGKRSQKAQNITFDLVRPVHCISFDAWYFFLVVSLIEEIVNGARLKCVGLFENNFALIRLPKTKTPRQNDLLDSETPNVSYNTTIIPDALVLKLISERKSVEMFQRKERVTY